MLRRHQDQGLFDRLAEHYERIWTHASQPIPTNTSKDGPDSNPARDRPPTRQEAQHALDRLRTQNPL